MKSSIIIITTLLGLNFLTKDIYGGGMYAPRYFSQLRGDFEIPDEIKKVTSLSELQPFLESKDGLTKMAAIRRLGEIEGSRAIGKLSEYCTLATIPLPSSRKLEAIRTLGRIDSEKAKSVVLDLLKQYWKRGPLLPEKAKGDKKFFEMDEDFTYTVPELLKALYKWSSDEDVFEMAKTISLSEDVKKYYHGEIGHSSWEINLKGEMLRKGIIEEKDTIKYLLDRVEDIIKKDSIPVELGLRKEVALDMLRKISEASLSSVRNEFNEQFAKESSNPDGSLTESQKTLRNKINNLEYAIREIKEIQEKLKK